MFLEKEYLGKHSI